MVCILSFQPPHLELATFQGFHSHVWLMPIVLDSSGLQPKREVRIDQVSLSESFTVSYLVLTLYLIIMSRIVHISLIAIISCPVLPCHTVVSSLLTS